jgi:hypothetical protein
MTFETDSNRNASARIIFNSLLHTFAGGFEKNEHSRVYVEHFPSRNQRTVIPKSISLFVPQVVIAAFS